MVKSEHIGRLQKDIASYPSSQVRKRERDRERDREENATYPKKLVKQACPFFFSPNNIKRRLGVYLRAFIELTSRFLTKGMQRDPLTEPSYYSAIVIMAECN